MLDLKLGQSLAKSPMRKFGVFMTKLGQCICDYHGRGLNFKTVINNPAPFILDIIYDFLAFLLQLHVGCKFLIRFRISSLVQIY
jgi:hypothetical protein